MNKENVPLLIVTLTCLPCTQSSTSMRNAFRYYSFKFILALYVARKDNVPLARTLLGLLPR
jgi:hypothetical protein